MHYISISGNDFFRQHPGERTPECLRNHGCLLPWLSKMAESASVRDPCIISWQARINNKAHNAKCECLCLHKDAQQVHLSSLRFHFVQQRALPARMTSVWKLCLIILLCATSQNAQHSQDLMIIGSSGHREKERDACQSGYIRGWPGGDGSVHDTSVTGHRETLSSPPPSAQANGCQVSEGLRSCLVPACCHVKSIRGRKHTGWAVDW